MAERDPLIKAISRTLAPGGRLVIGHGKKPDHWPLWLFNLFVSLGRPFGLTLDYFDGHPWESVGRYFQEVTFEEMYGGAMYISSGTARR